MAKKNAKNAGKHRNRHDPPLQPLRLPPGWAVDWNTFFEVEARFKSWDQVSMNFAEDMLLLINDYRGVYISLDWFPAHGASGAFFLRAVRQIHHPEHGRCGDWSRPLKQMKTRSRRKAVETIEAWLEWYAVHGVPAARKSRS
jgi:hypothetical protein